MELILVEYFDEDKSWVAHGYTEWQSELDKMVSDTDVINFMRSKGYEYKKEMPTEKGIAFTFRKYKEV